MYNLFHAAAKGESGNTSVVWMEAEDSSSSSIDGLDRSSSKPRNEFLTPSLLQNTVLQNGIGSTDSYEK